MGSRSASSARLARVRLLACVSSFALVACEDAVNMNCTSIAILPVTVYVRDAVTEAGIASGATLVLASAGYLDSATYEEGFPHVNDMPLGVFSSEERPGTYSATVRRAGYASWDTVGVLVTADQCHVRPKVLTARLQPLP